MATPQSTAGKTLHAPLPLADLECAADVDGIAQQLASQVSAQLPAVLHQLLHRGFTPGQQPLRLSCHLTAGGESHAHQAPTRDVQVASLDIGRALTPIASAAISRANGTPQSPTRFHPNANEQGISSNAWQPSTWPARNSPIPMPPPDEDARSRKRRREVAAPPDPIDEAAPTTMTVARRDVRENVQQQKKRISDNPALQPSSLEKLINGIWDSLFSGVRMDPTEIIAQWQTIESSRQPRLLTDANHEIAPRSAQDAFGRMSVLARKISQTTKACRSLEVIVQAHWITCFDDRVAELAQTITREKARKAAICEACSDFNWTEKELRNKMAIWRGYHEIKQAAGWSALVFAGMGLYRFCKYRVSFTEDTFQTLRRLQHRFEVAADTLHPRWRTLLGIVDAPTTSKYTGHLHDWVVNGPDNEAIPLPKTYHKWDKNFSYTHLPDSVIDEEAWGDYDPRSVVSGNAENEFTCQSCGEQQSSTPTDNACNCYANLYGSPKSSLAPVQIFRTANGKNNGLIACGAFEKGWAVGEFVGELTTGIRGLDVMIDRTERASYQIWQGRKGNHTRFINHSCEPNTHYERFVWLGKQRSVLVSDGIAAGDEITVDYGNTYWDDLDKECLCGRPTCRYRRRQVTQLVTPPNGESE